MKKILILMSLCIIFGMQSCTSDSEPIMSEMNGVNSEISHMVVKFDGKIYETDVLTTEDSVKYLNEDYAEVYDRQISKIKDGATLLYTDENGIFHVEYFHSEKELVEKYEFGEIKRYEAQPGTRGKVIDLTLPDDGSILLAKAELYDDKNYGEPVLYAYASNIMATAVPYLKELGFNDKTSSIRVVNYMNPSASYTMWNFSSPSMTIGYSKVFRGSELRPVLLGYHNSNYSGAVLYCIAPPTGSSALHTDDNLKKIKWNDRISSIAWEIVCHFEDFEGENPKIPAHDDC